MRYSNQMEEGIEYCSSNWNDTCANFYIKTGNIVTTQTVYRWGKSPEPLVMTLVEFDKWISEINVLKGQEVQNVI